jgi:hypothetical protein
VRHLPDPGFAGDGGATAPAVDAALQEVAGGAPLPVAVAALCESRVLVPVVAVVAEVEHDAAGLAREKTADMAAVLMTGRDGRKALLAFTGLAAMRTWDPEARPVPVGVEEAARAALDEGADALVVDVAGPVQVPIEGVLLRRLARGHRLVRTEEGFAWAVPAG